MASASRWLRIAAGLSLVISALVASTSGSSAAHITTVRAITFPVSGEASYSADFLAPRSGGRQHKGTDIFAPKLRQVVAANAGTVVRISGANSGLSGNWLVIRDAEGWEYSYFHLNNDSPDTDDGANPVEWIFAPGIVLNAQVAAGQALGFIGDSGNAENTPPHVHFGIKRPDRTSINPWPSLRAAQGLERGERCVWSRNPSRTPDPLSGSGQWATTAAGVVTTHGSAPDLGDLSGLSLNDPIVGMTTTNSGEGFWLVAADGGVFAFGDAGFYGSTGAIRLNKPIVGMAATVTGLGYWLVASDGGIFAYGDAEFYGSTGDIALNAPVAGMATTADGRGYWLVASDGGVFSFGDAEFVGSLPGAEVEAQIIGVAAPSGKSGYWLLNAEGGVYAFGDVVWHGSVQSAGFCETRTGSSIVATRTGAGYWIQSNDGRIWPFGDAATIDDAAPAGVLALTPSGGPPEIEAEPNPDAKP